jgi:hypothetical protein
MSITAIQRVMTASCFSAVPRYFRAPAPRRTIGQECDRNVTLPWEAGPCRANDADLVLLDDADIGHAGIWEFASIQAQTAR